MSKSEKFGVCLFAAAAALAPAGCGAEAAPGRPERSSSSAPALCRPLQARIAGRVALSAATELSGLVLSRTQAGVLWTHNDSGDSARILAIDRRGATLGQLEVPGAQNVDWEDIAIGPAPGPGDALYIGDIGDNAARRPEVVVYRVPEPRVSGTAPGATAPARRLALRYPDGPHDAEALLVDPASGALTIVTKDYAGDGVYVAARPSARATTTLRRAGGLALGLGEAVTAGDVSGDGRTVALRTYDRAFVWSRRPGQAISSVLRRRPCRAGAGLAAEGQGEAMALTLHGRSFYTVPEGERPALRRYAPR